MPILHWLTRDEDFAPDEPRALPLAGGSSRLSAGGKDAGNMLIQGDNLEALKALLPFYAGRVKCIYIDPPYNTKLGLRALRRQSRTHPMAGHDVGRGWNCCVTCWLKMASIWVSIDDNEGHYLKVMMDEVFGRKNFIAQRNLAKELFTEDRVHVISQRITIIFLFTRGMPTIGYQTRCRARRSRTKATRTWTTIRAGLWTTEGPLGAEFLQRREVLDNMPSGRVIEGPPGGTYWRVSEEKFWEMDRRRANLVGKGW